MRFRWLMVVALGMAVVKPASSQVSIYAEMSASKLTGGIATQTTTVLYGPTFGVTAQIATKAHLNIYADVRGAFIGGTTRLDGVGIGPKIGLPLKKKYEAYTELIVGFARYNNGQNLPASSSTDSQIQLNSGLDRQITPRFDWRILEFGYEQYYGLGGEYNPKSFSTGVVLHLQKR